MIEFIEYKIEEKEFKPRESIAAWLVSAIKDGYQTPEYFKTKAKLEEGRRIAKEEYERNRKRRKEIFLKN